MTIDTMSNFNEQHFEKRLTTLKDSQESIQSLSTWCLQHRQHHKKIVILWHKVLKKVKLDHRLTLFYLANDVIQYSKRRNYEFVESWGTALQRATTMVRDEKVRDKILRIFKIWGERGIYDDTFITDLCGLMSTPSRKKPVESENESMDNGPDPLDFHPSELFKKIRVCHTLEDDTDLRLKQLNESHKVFTDADALRSHLKDRRQGEDVVTEVDEGGKMMEAYMTALGAEIKERRLLIEELDLADKFYETQQGDARLVVSAYKNFGNRVNNLKRHLDERMATYACPSPIPSPDVNAPSPEPDCDIELPEDRLSAGFIPGLGDVDQSQDILFPSFLGKSFDFQENLFGDPFDEQNGSEGKPIEVINSRAETEMESSINNFLKSLGNLTSSAPAPAIQEPYAVYTAPLPPPPPPPTLFSNLPPKFPTWEEGDVWEEGEEWLGEKEGGLETPDSPPLCEKESFAEPLEYDDSATLDVDHRSDVDHRLLHIPLPAADVDHRITRHKDVDHRNLISLTGSPGQEGGIGIPRPPLPPWPVDQDYRPVSKTVAVDGSDVDYRMPPPPPPPPPPAPIRLSEEMRDNVESVDMDLSDDESAEQSGAETSVKRERPCEDMNNVKPLISLPHPLTPPPTRPPPPPMPSMMTRPPFRPRLPNAPRSLLSMPILPPPHLPPPNGTPTTNKKMRIITKLEQDEENDKFLDEVIDLEFTDAAMMNGCMDQGEDGWQEDMNGRLRAPLLRTPPSEVEHWQDEDIPSFNDWNNRGHPRGPGFPRAGFPPRGRAPGGRASPHMGGGPMRRPFGGRPGPRGFVRPYMARPGSYGSW